MREWQLIIKKKPNGTSPEPLKLNPMNFGRHNFKFISGEWYTHLWLLLEALS